MSGMLRVHRSRGVLSGALLILLGAWGGLIPFIGPYVHYAYSPDRAWAYTTGRLTLEVLPAIATLIGGMIVLISGVRPVAIFGAWLAAISGAWFAVGGALASLWTSGTVPAQGTPVGGTTARAVEQIGFFAGLGVAVVFLAAVALGRFSVVAVKDLAATGRAKRATAVGAADAVAATSEVADEPAKKPSALTPWARKLSGRKASAAEPSASEPSAREPSDAGARAR